MNDLCDWTRQGQAGSGAVRDTIFAPATGVGAAGIAIIRISGSRADACLLTLTGRPLPEARVATMRRLLAADGSLLDSALVLRFTEDASYTGEAVVELHCHGSVAVVAKVLEVLSERPGCRLAEPGEFTRRAFEAGRMDLAEVEALGDLLAAETETQRRHAMRGFGGELHRLADRWRADLLRALALIEVTIDWADEEVPEEVPPEVDDLLRGLATSFERELAGAGAAERLRDGFEVALVGAPNAGKSSLLNALAGRDAAITSALPGTTRDVIELRYDLRGLPVVFLDMAGLRNGKDEVEAIGVERARMRAGGAALRVFLDAPDAPLGDLVEGLRQEGDLVVPSKADLARGSSGVSAKTGQGVDALLGCIEDRLIVRAADAGLVGRLRQRRALATAHQHLVAACGTAVPELRAEEIRGALVALDRMLGGVGVEDVLGEVFSNFCLGK